MAKSKSSLLLKVISVIFFAWGIFFAVTKIIELTGGSADLGAIGYASVVTGWVGAIIEFVAGFIGLKGKNLKLGKILVLVLVSLVAYSAILAVKDGFAWTDLAALGNLILPVLYCVGVDKAEKKG